jgi:hypothetical protein
MPLLPSVIKREWYVCIIIIEQSKNKSIQYSVSLLQLHNIIKQCLTIMDPGGHAIRKGDDKIRLAPFSFFYGCRKRRLKDY